MGIGHRVQDVLGLRAGARLVFVDQHDFLPDPLHHQRIGGSGTHEAAADDPDFHSFFLRI
jgi:hypothetical protein